MDGLDHFTSFCTGYCQTLPRYSVVILSIMKTLCDTGLQTRSTSKTLYPYRSLSLLLQSFKEHVAVSRSRLQVYKRFHGQPLMWELDFTCLFLPVKQIAATYFFSAAKNVRFKVWPLQRLHVFIKVRFHRQMAKLCRQEVFRSIWYASLQTSGHMQTHLTFQNMHKCLHRRQA